MADHTLPIGGGWIMVKRRLPTVIQVPLLSMFYALPDRVFPAGWHSRFAAADYTDSLSAEKLSLLWRHRAKGKLTANEKATVEIIERDADDRDVSIDLDQRVRITAADGEVCLEPYEWVRVADLTPYLSAIDGESIKLHDYGVKPTGSMADSIFYLRSRGIPTAEAYRLLVGEVRKPNVFWLELHPSYAEFFHLDKPRERKRSLGLPPMRVTITEGSHADG